MSGQHRDAAWSSETGARLPRNTFLLPASFGCRYQEFSQDKTKGNELRDVCRDEKEVCRHGQDEDQEKRA